MDDLIRCSMCSHDWADHQMDRREPSVPWLRCAAVARQHVYAVDDWEDVLCGCEQPLLRRDEPVEVLWLMARAARLLDDEHLSCEGERKRLLEVAEAVQVATEARV